MKDRYSMLRNTLHSAQAAPSRADGSNIELEKLDISWSSLNKNKRKQK